MEDEIDISWILEQERLENIEQNCLKEPLTDINVVYIYVNHHNEIDTVEKEIMDISGISVLKKEKILQIVQSKKKHTPTSKYVLKDTLWFHVDIEPENIASISEENTSFLHTYPILEDILLSPSIFIFHKINTLYFIYHEIWNEKNIPHSSILKNGHNNTKKKVQIMDIPHQIKTTRKNMHPIENDMKKPA